MTADSTYFDVVIVGGGVMGSAAAYFLTHEPLFTGSVAIIERDTSFAECSTGRSAGGLRQQFSTPENIEMSLYGLQFIRRLKERFGPDADVSFREQGYLMLASETGLETLRENVELQRSYGADIVLYNEAELHEAFPWLSTEGLVAGAFGRSGEGWLDPFSLMTLMRKAAQAKGASMITGTVTGFAMSDGQVEAVELSDGRRIGCGTLINAAGADAGKVGAMLSIELPVERRKRFVFVFDCRDAPGRCPLTIEPTGLYFRPEGAHFITGLGPLEGEWDTSDLEVNHNWFEEEIWPRLAARVSAFEAIKPTGAWAGFYDYNTFDQNAIIGRHPDFDNLYLMNGSSGHGLQHGPAAGRAISELIVHGAYQTIDLSRLSYDRIRRGEPLFEKNVV
ncbi:NAD(P)/FAD-dependent oxidoreductase [Rhodoligotrophos defluvii]|uniref:NAD(P)/FAD-dependent oxidoreductase n=1 Tax=Rhodoligotrophos defluvii TaxID=2561934 RepID=UPI0010C96268|nr:FAD-binding oxidoreductase [Rhodoligotrophos defluvii]